MGAVKELHGIALPSRYEIRPIEPQHEEWCRALLAQALLLRAPIWRPLIPEPKVKTILTGWRTLEPYYGHSLRNGLSYAVYDKEYVFKRPESVASGGALYWDEINAEDPELEVKGEQWMLDGLDFPIVSLALSYDLLQPPPKEAYAAMGRLLPAWGAMMAQFTDTAQTIPNLPQPTEIGQYAHRSGCITRSEYEGKGLGKLASWWVMHEMAAKGFWGLLVGAGNDQISKIWLHKDAPFRVATIIKEDLWQVELEVDGQKIRPYKGHPLRDFRYLQCDLKERKTGLSSEAMGREY
ncbi:hypothetical protein JX265_009895 [Neoarthrinium moseri]|uniref:Uncharacterized protein n=1 Tax=Neoarthrinium moseri TaxID=1658444 RepID=A0A9P9WEZ0_9PEZI|nr:hypothetical protein JX265_009895 [Neoarthrinium moseri]